MSFIEQGHGASLVFIPGLQGRWEYARGTIDALSAHFRVISFSLADEPAARFAFDPDRGFDSYADHVRSVLDTARAERAIVCGLSFGGLVALRFAAVHPDRVSALVLASTPGPGWRLRPRHDLYARVPWIFGAAFLVEVPFRARPELLAALPDRRQRLAFARHIARTLVRAPVSLSRMATRARRIGGYDTREDCARIAAPTLVVTGEAALDYVVSVEGSSQYGRLITGARSAVLRETGHQGTLTRPHAFASLVREFVDTGLPRGQVA